MLQAKACGCLVAAVVAGGLTFTGLGVAVEDRLGLPALFAVRGERQPPPGALVLAVDQASRSWLASLPEDFGAWPAALRHCLGDARRAERVRSRANAAQLPRDLYACAIERAVELGAESVALHVAFNEPSPFDGLLRQSLASHRDRIVLLQYVERAEEGPRLLPVAPSLGRNLPTAPFILPSLGGPVVQYWLRLDWSTMQHAPVSTLPVAVVEKMAARSRPDLAPPTARLDGETGYFNHYGPAGTIPTASVAALFADDLISADGGRMQLILDEVVVFVGEADARAPSQRDRFPTAFDPAVGVPGVELAATAYLNLLHEEDLHRLSYGGRAGAVALLTMACFALALRADVRLALGGIALIGIGYGVVAIALFSAQAVWLPVMTPLAVVVPAAMGLSFIRQYLVVRSWLGEFAPRRLVDLLLKDQHRPRYLGSREVAVMFTDLAGYTRFAQAHDPADVAVFLNAHFRDAVMSVEAEGGLVASFTGDGLVAFWGAPEPMADAPERAARAAIALANRFAEAYHLRRRSGLDAVRLRIGLHCGVGTAALVGGRARRSYTVVGDVVNTTQRVEQLGKRFFGEDDAFVVLASAAFCKRLPAGYRTEPLGAHAIPGHDEPLAAARLSADGFGPLRSGTPSAASVGA